MVFAQSSFGRVFFAFPNVGDSAARALLFMCRQDKVAMDLGFYYMANAMGRLVGTLVGGFLYYYTVSRRAPVSFIFIFILSFRVDNVVARGRGGGGVACRIPRVRWGRASPKIRTSWTSSCPFDPWHDPTLREIDKPSCCAFRLTGLTTPTSYS